MKTIFLVFGAACLISALTWFFIWAICVHSTASVYGPGAANMGMSMPPAEKARLENARVWVRRIRTLTLILLALAVITGGLALYSSE